MAERLDRLAHTIKREVSSILATEVKDPRLGMISITDVEVSRDLAVAKIYFSQLGGEEERARTLDGLERAKGFIRSELAKRLRVRHTPEIVFLFDPSLEHGAKISALLKSLQSPTEEEIKEDETPHEQP
ncbi:MAG: 30S ribosome-binding factor RbfA [Limnochordia bacterium]|jgi:ribosome-binding factor A|nr:30S ribosome-binding factor RbfA [Limnochordia bacterium]MDI9464895.1 30S ribosome-binding factor RbfA [Bacillota bacterium]NLO95216.1 30S ribosome-binding factor RbfA [Bacillota bacterium]HAI53039.1 30S ribosome-binding factor RbfA [Bacillota bacterium]HAN95383.1 30S ribosome-binding factor RbfA [Bacillota bacterium]